MDLIVQVIAAYIVTVAAGVTLESPRRIVYRTGIIGAVSYAVYLILANYFGVGQVMGYFISCLIASIISQFFARRYKTAVILFYVPTFYLYVPGSTIYQMAYNFISGQPDAGAQSLVQTLMIAGAIALGIFIADSIMTIYLDVKNRSIQSLTKINKR
ncbi:MAG: threonine/serine exporter family protein [Atopococcus tabaci]|uniref:Threonine/serine exporter family protein n=1 Tax=Atopococcus tabaci TaxID=269774 RepID=A0AA43RKK8_9LACT|nr:threonine/serine exporter family protein [Atopococcus tabaci]